MADRERTADSLIKAGAVIIYCVAHTQHKGTHKEKCKYARERIIVEFPGVPSETIEEIERKSLASLSGTITRW